MSAPNLDRAELKACPWCNTLKEEIVDATRILGLWRLIHRCKVVGPLEIQSTIRERVVELWNTRPLESSLAARVAELVALIHEGGCTHEFCTGDDHVAGCLVDNLTDQELAAARERQGA